MMRKLMNAPVPLCKQYTDPEVTAYVTYVGYA